MIKLKKFPTAGRFIKVYTIDELDYDAQRNAYNEWLSSVDYPWESENRESLNAFCSRFNIGRVDYEYGGYRPPWIEADIRVSGEVDTLRGLRLRTYILNNFGDVLFKPKYLRHVGGKPRYSKVKVDRVPNFSGYYLYYNICKPLYDFIDHPDRHTSLSDLLQECLWEWVNECHKDMESFYSFENFEETAMVLGWLYNKQGKRVN